MSSSPTPASSIIIAPDRPSVSHDHGLTILESGWELHPPSDRGTGKAGNNSIGPLCPYQVPGAAGFVRPADLTVLEILYDILHELRTGGWVDMVCGGRGAKLRESLSHHPHAS
jgi:hypothetical protein